MKLPIYQIDAFTNEAFKGNSAAVVPLDSWLPDAVMQSIALENNLSETVFFVPAADGAADTFDIRWFSPIKEIDFLRPCDARECVCDIRENPGISVIKFVAKAVGTLSAVKLPDGLIEMSFPKRSPEPLSSIPASLLEGLSIPPQESLKNQQAYFAVYDTEEEVRAVVPDLRKLVALGPLDVVVTAPGVHHDFVSRYFWPANGGDEDPVTGSIHAGLAPFWAGRLGKNDLLALQVSQRTGLLKCRVEADRVHVAGAAVQYLEGTIEVPSV